jgi:hypothetical protein
MDETVMRALVLGFLLVSAVSRAGADEADPRARATQITNAAIASHEAGDYLVALDGFRKAYAVYLEALEAFEHFLANVPDASERARGFALARVAVLQQKIGSIHVRCPVSGAQVELDGKPLGAGPLDIEARLMPGTHLVGAHNGGYLPYSSTIELHAGDRVDAMVRLVRPVQGKPTYKKAWFWATLGGIAVTAAGATLIGIYAQPHNPSPSLGTGSLNTIGGAR